MAARILVPLDGSSLAEQALPCAVTLARGLPGELVLLRAIWIPPDILEMLDESTVELNAIVAQLETEANGYLDPLVEQLREAGLNARFVVRRGPAAETILDYAGQVNVDQIVMATHGYSGIKHWTHGSVAERVLQAARMPLLLVRVGEQDLASDWQQPARCRRILVPLDGSPVAEQILPSVVSVAQAMSGELVLFQVPRARDGRGRCRGIPACCRRPPGGAGGQSDDRHGNWLGGGLHRRVRGSQQHGPDRHVHPRPDGAGALGVGQRRRSGSAGGR
jgi:nucleotide-binding universal stress UspA family protein